MDGEDASSHLEIYPPPNGVHKDRLMCEGHFPSVETQQQNRVIYKKKLNDTLAQANIMFALEDTKENLRHVKEMLHSHGDLILARWKKYSPKRRLELLNKASTMFSPPSSEPFGGPEDSANTYFSWLDTTGFSEDRMRLMSLLHVRSEYGPEQWAAFDTRSTWLACHKKRWVRCVHNANAVVMHGEQYGKLVPFAVNSAHS